MKMYIKLIIALAILAILVYALFVFDIARPEPQGPSDGAALSQCVPSGCSGEICADSAEGPVVSTCIYRSEYACYKAAKCERQASGQCGWTETPELASCIAAAAKEGQSPISNPQ